MYKMYNVLGCLEVLATYSTLNLPHLIMCCSRLFLFVAISCSISILFFK